MQIRGVQTYNEGVEVCLKATNSESREEPKYILTLSERQVQWLEAQLHLIGTVGAWKTIWPIRSHEKEASRGT